MSWIRRHRAGAVLCLFACVAAPSASAAGAAAKARKAGPGISSAPAVDPIAVAAAERDALAARVEALESVQSVEVSARWLSGQAWDTQDPWVHIMAARTWLKVQTSDVALDRAEFHAREAAALADAPPVPRIPLGDVARVHADADAVQATVADRRAEIRRTRAARRAADRQFRRGRRELFAGGAMLLLATLGGGVALAGSTYKRRFDEAVQPVLAADLPIDLSPLRRLDVQGDHMVIAGAVLAGIGVAAGVPLLVLGARDMKIGRRERAMTLQLRPGLGSLGVIGRF